MHPNWPTLSATRGIFVNSPTTSSCSSWSDPAADTAPPLQNLLHALPQGSTMPATRENACCKMHDSHKCMIPMAMQTWAPAPQPCHRARHQSMHAATAHASNTARWHHTCLSVTPRIAPNHLSTAASPSRNITRCLSACLPSTSSRPRVWQQLQAQAEPSLVAALLADVLRDLRRAGAAAAAAAAAGAAAASPAADVAAAGCCCCISCSCFFICSKYGSSSTAAIDFKLNSPRQLNLVRTSVSPIADSSIDAEWLQQ
ncbi:hypothetical protein COO60DRAFT_871902 [Scenedesmus sp. NREL 46B-D3]|nr:hypothetical protein COO60DRAFT_871902 [Scenedesmus sp. NREL 46B-D3]